VSYLDLILSQQCSTQQQPITSNSTVHPAF
jgi:hypothetical protein